MHLKMQEVTGNWPRFFLCNMLFVLTMATALHGTSTWFALGNGSQKATMHGTLPSHDAMTNKELAPKKMLYQEE